MALNPELAQNTLFLHWFRRCVLPCISMYCLLLILDCKKPVQTLRFCNVSTLAVLGVSSMSAVFASFIVSLTSLSLDIGLGRRRVEHFRSSISIGIYKVSCMVPRRVSGRLRLGPRHRRVSSPRPGILSSQDACLVPLESSNGLLQPSERLWGRLRMIVWCLWSPLMGSGNPQSGPGVPQQ